MAEKRLNTRIVLKHGVESSWRSIDQVFTPFKGEVIVYDPDGTHSKARLKIGDGSTTLRKLPFIGEQEMAQAGSATQPVYVDENGTIQAVTHTLGADVPSDAVFTDTKYTMVAGKTSGASSYDLSVKDPYINLVSNGVGENVIQLKSGKNINITTDSSTGKIVTIAFNGTIPTSLPTTNSLTVQTNGSNVFTFNGAYGRTLNLESGDNITLTPDTSGKVTISASVPQVADEKVATSPRNTALGMKYYLTGTSSSTANTKGTLAIDTDVYLDTTAGTLYSNYYRGTRTTLTAPVNDTVETEDIAGETSVDPQIMLKYAGSTQGGGQIKGSHKTMRFTALGSAGTSRTLTLRNAESASPEMDNALTVDVVNADASQASYRVFHSGMSSAIPVNLGGTGATTMDTARDNLGAAAKEHIHGAISANGAIGTTADKAIYTGTNGVLQAGTLPISGGGTGAQTAEAARTSLGAAAKEHTHTMSEITDYEAPTVDLSGYVKKTDVVDTLTSDVADAPLSAKQGKALNENIENVKSNYLPLTGGELEGQLVLPAIMEGDGLYFKDYNNSGGIVASLSCAQDGSTGIFSMSPHASGGYDYTSIGVALDATGDIDHLLNLYWNTGSSSNKNAYVYHSKMTSAIPLTQGGTGFTADSTKTKEEQLAALKTYLGITSVSVFTGATADNAGEQGLVPEPAAGDQGAVLTGDGTWQKIVRDDSALFLMEDGYTSAAGGVVGLKIGNTSYLLPAGIYTGGRAGVVPRFNDDYKADASNTDPSTAFLRADGKWAVPESGSGSGTNSVFTSTANGLVPATGSQHYSFTSFLTGAGAWVSYETFAGQTSGVRNFVPPYSSSYIYGDTSSTTAFLRADGKWAVPAGGGSEVFTSDTDGLVPAPTSVSANVRNSYVLAADGSWVNRYIYYGNFSETGSGFTPACSSTYRTDGSSTNSASSYVLRGDAKWVPISTLGGGSSTSVSYTDNGTFTSNNYIGILKVGTSESKIWAPKFSISNNYTSSTGTKICSITYGDSSYSIYAPSSSGISGGAKVTVSSSAPSSPSTGDIWIQT